MWRGNHLLWQSRLALQCMEYHSRTLSLLQNDTDIETKEKNLEKIRKVPAEEKRSFISEERCCLHSVSICIWKREVDNKGIINHFKTSLVLSKPKGYEVWTKESVDDNKQTTLQRTQADHWFAWQRLNGVTRNLIKRVHEVPQQDVYDRFFPSLDDIQENHPYLEGLTLDKHAKNGTLYAVDLTDITMGEDTPAAPMALFTVWKTRFLMPVALNVNANLPDGKVYKPSTLGTPEDVRKWVNARMWFNMVDAQFHESITHLGMTHILMDGVSVCMHRNLSDRHPIYKLLLPHFQYMHAINKDAQTKLIEPGGFVDKDMYFGHVHMLKLIASRNKNWSYPVNASIHASLNSREANDIPGYFFKDDALRLHEAIHQYVSEYASHYYRKRDLNVRGDQEIQAFRQELVRPRSMNEGGGCGMNGIPEFDNIETLVDVLTNFIYFCNVEHSATNFPQYDQYAFPPNMAATLHKSPNRSALNLDNAMPSGSEMFSAITVMKILTLVLTNSLGNYPSNYLKQMDNEENTFVRNFQRNLAVIQNEINQRNAAIIESNKDASVQEYPYDWLLPDKVLNSISI